MAWILPFQRALFEIWDSQMVAAATTYGGNSRTLHGGRLGESGRLVVGAARLGHGVARRSVEVMYTIGRVKQQ